MGRDGARPSILKGEIGAGIPACLSINGNRERSPYKTDVLMQKTLC